MKLESQKYFFDIQLAASQLQTFIAGMSREQYLANAMARAAVERQFEIIGEATAQLAKIDTASVKLISDYRRLIAFRNILIHGYADVDHELIWDLTQTRLPELLKAIQPLTTAPKPI